MVDPVADRLAKGDDHTGNYGGLFAQLLHDPVEASAFQVESYFDLAGIGEFAVFVLLPATGATGGLFDRRMGQQQLFDLSCYFA